MHRIINFQPFSPTNFSRNLTFLPSFVRFTKKREILSRRISQSEEQFEICVKYLRFCNPRHRQSFLFRQSFFFYPCSNVYCENYTRKREKKSYFLSTWYNNLQVFSLLMCNFWPWILHHELYPNVCSVIQV